MGSRSNRFGTVEIDIDEPSRRLAEKDADIATFYEIMERRLDGAVLPAPADRVLASGADWDGYPSAFSVIGCRIHGRLRMLSCGRFDVWRG